jgi:phosphatidylinositol glycan class T
MRSHAPTTVLTDDRANTRWFALTNALSGLFCASLNFIDTTRTIRPVKTFEPEGVHPASMLPNLQLLHGALPHEVVCTENLTPFLKLLPCKGKAGISSLLDGHKLFDASWQVMAIDIRPVCSEDEVCLLEIEQTVDMVLDMERSKRPRGMATLCLRVTLTDLRQSHTETSSCGATGM